ncbi:MAG: TolC family protein [Bacteroidota bacterium]
MKRIVFFSLIFSSLYITGQTKWSLDSCISYAKKKNVLVQKQRLENLKLDSDLKLSKFSYFPEVTFSGTQGYNLGNSFNVSTSVGQRSSRFNSFDLSARVDLFNGLKKKYDKEKAEINKKNGDIEIDIIHFDISLEIIDKYSKALFSREALKAAEEQEKISKRELERLERLFSEKLVSKKEILEIEAAYFSDLKEVINAKNDFKVNLSELKGILDVVDIENFDIEDIDSEINPILGMPFLPVNLDKEELVKSNPYLLSSRLSVEKIQKEISSYKSEFLPSLSFAYSLNTSYFKIIGEDDIIFNPISGLFEENGFFTQLSNNQTNLLLFSLNVPIFRKYQNKNNLDKSRINLKLAEIDFKNKTKELINTVDMAINSLLSYQKALEIATSAYDLQQEAFTISQKKYEEGLISNHKFLDSKSSLLRSRLEYIQTKFTYIFHQKITKLYFQ